jgi:hypothetical protein
LPFFNTVFRLKGYGAPETKAAAERARLLIEQAEALGVLGPLWFLGH